MKVHELITSLAGMGRDTEVSITSPLGTFHITEVQFYNIAPEAVGEVEVLFLSAKLDDAIDDLLPEVDNADNFLEDPNLSEESKVIDTGEDNSGDEEAGDDPFADLDDKDI